MCLRLAIPKADKAYSRLFTGRNENSFLGGNPPKKMVKFIYYHTGFNTQFYPVVIGGGNWQKKGVN
jgi:hypothetical protein